MHQFVNLSCYVGGDIVEVVGVPIGDVCSDVLESPHDKLVAADNVKTGSFQFLFHC